MALSEKTGETYVGPKFPNRVDPQDLDSRDAQDNLADIGNALDNLGQETDDLLKELTQADNKEATESIKHDTNLRDERLNDLEDTQDITNEPNEQDTTNWQDEEMEDTRV